MKPATRHISAKTIVLLYLLILLLPAGCTRNAPPYPGIVRQDPWSKAVWETQRILSHNPDLADHLESYSESTEGIQSILKWIEPLRTLSDTIDDLDSIRVPGYGDTVWGAFVDILDFAIPKGKYLVGLIRDTVALLVRLEVRLQDLRELKDAAQALRAFQKSPSPRTLQRLDREIPKAVEILHSTSVDVIEVRDILSKPREMLTGMAGKVGQFSGDLPFGVKTIIRSSKTSDKILSAAKALDTGYLYLDRLSLQLDQDRRALEDIHRVVANVQTAHSPQNSWAGVVFFIVVSAIVAFGIGTLMGLCGRS